MKDEAISGILFGISFFCFVVGFAIIYFETAPTTYGVRYEFDGIQKYSEVSGNPAEIIDELNSRQINILNISPIR